MEFEHFQQARIIVPKFCPGPPLKNLSHKVFAPKELSILTKVLIYAMAQTQLNLLEIITSAEESGIFSFHGEAENPDLLRGEIVRSILDYKLPLSLSTQ